jgi:hypothetical protein
MAQSRCIFAARRQNPSVDVIEAVDGDPLIDDAAWIWAEATAARDGHGEVAGPDVARPAIQGVLDRSPRAFLLIARSAAGTAGFAAMEPLAGRGGVLAQVSYIGVRPRLWGGRCLAMFNGQGRLRQAGRARGGRAKSR